MPINLRIENFDQLPDGGPVEFNAGSRGFDIGREQHLDWTLPDPNRVISGHHCQVRYENGAYWLHDISRNGTFVNGAQGRVASPYRLNNGDRLQIGQYYVRVTIPPAGGFAAEPPPQYPPQTAFPAGGDDLWGTSTPAPAPADRRWFANEQSRGQRAPDVMDHFMDLPTARNVPQPSSPFGAPSPQLQAVPGSGVYEQGAAPGAFGQPAPGMGVGMGMPAPAAPAYAGGGGMNMPAGQFLQQLAQSAGISPQALANRDPADLANEFGAILRLLTEQLMALLQARATAKLMAKSSNRTMLGPQNNNPLKFVPDAREAMEIMFQRSKPGYLTAAAAYKEGFDNVKAHEIATYSAMQKALLQLMEDLTPENIEDKAGGAFGNKKARSWDIFVERWNAKTEHTENGIVDVFLRYFAEAYDAANKK